MKFKGGCNPITHLTLMDPPMEHKVHTKNNFQIPRGVLTFPLNQLDPPTVYGSIVNCAPVHQQCNCRRDQDREDNEKLKKDSDL